MHRRALRTAVVVCAICVALLATIGTPSTVAATPQPEPPTTISDDFFPESANLSDCLGFVERPGCGAEGRGGTGQTLAFVALAAGLGVIFWRVSVGVRRNRARTDA